jgi:two-component system sensor histidine kinase/response regulator
MNAETFATSADVGGDQLVSADHVVRILVADDQSANIQIIGNVLGKFGYEIVPASDGPTALKRMAVRPPDLVLLDVLMPGMDGLEVCRRIRENPEWKHIPVIFLSAADDKDLIVRALEAGGVDYVTKPFNQAEMVSRVRTHLALKAAHDRLKQLAEDKDELLGILAHDLKNHLGGMQMSANLLRERMAKSHDSKPVQLCENICHSTGQLLAFVKEFLANSAADHSMMLQSNPLDFSKAVSRAAEDYREAARRKNLELRLDLPTESAIVLGDPNALAQVLDNLLSNAVKFSPEEKQISITVRLLPAAVECLIQDQGPGFTDEDKARMFRRYGRLSARPTGGEPSTGLGLSIVKKLVHGMHGELICESAPGQGSTFTIRLPQPATST